MKPLTFSIKTLGCKVNKYEADKLQQQLEAAGLTASESWSGLDCIIINTCTVTHVADRKSRQFISRAIKLNPGARVYVTGCATKTDIERISKLVGQELICADKTKLAQTITNHGQTRRGASQPSKPAPNPQPPIPSPRAYLMIEDGCDNFCTYCILPHIRGRVTCKPFSDVQKEAQKLVENGIKEIVLTGINTGKYNDKGKTLTEVCHMILSLPGPQPPTPRLRLRISSIEPELVTPELINLMAEEPRLCNHLHISLQSGCDKVLTAMNRKVCTTDYYKLLQFIRYTIPDVAITTDIIIGYPSETDTDFEETLAFVRKCAFAKIHAFPFSPRAGTPAAQLRKVYTDTDLRSRMNRLLELEQQQRWQFMNSQIGRTYPVLFEQEKNGYLTGYTPNYLPVKVKTSSRAAHINTITPGTLKAREGDQMVGKYV